MELYPLTHSHVRGVERLRMDGIDCPEEGKRPGVVSVSQVHRPSQRMSYRDTVSKNKPNLHQGENYRGLSAQQPWFPGRRSTSFIDGMHPRYRRRCAGANPRRAVFRRSAEVPKACEERISPRLKVTTISFSASSRTLVPLQPQVRMHTPSKHLMEVPAPGNVKLIRRPTPFNFRDKRRSLE